MALTSKLTAIADAIRAKTGGTSALTLDQMPTEIASIETGETVQDIDLYSILTTGSLGELSEYTEYNIGESGYIQYTPDNGQTSDVIFGKVMLSTDEGELYVMTLGDTVVFPLPCQPRQAGGRMFDCSNSYSYYAWEGTATAEDIMAGKVAGSQWELIEGTHVCPTPTYDTPSITVSSAGLITATANGKSGTQQLSTQAAKTITPTTSAQTAVTAGKYTTGAITVGAIPSNYIVPRGTKSITENGTYDVTSYASATVDVPTGSSDVPFAYGGMNASKVATYSETFSLADTSFVVGSTSSTSATSIKAAVSNRFTSATLTIGDKDIVVVQRVVVTPTYSGSQTNKGQFDKYCIEYVSHISKRRTNTSTTNSTRTTLNMSSAWLKYYNTSGGLTYISSSYGLYATPQAPSCASASSASTTVRASSPILYARASATYASAANQKCITDATFEWTVDVYLVDGGSSISRTIVNDCIAELYS